jgi:hypothetical protein
MSADTPYSLAGWDGFAAELRTVAGGALIGLGVVTVGDAAEGTVTARFPRAVTALITTAAVAYDVFAVNPAGETLMLFRGHACPVVARATFTVPPA